jgi:hypothetical protein
MKSINFALMAALLGAGCAGAGAGDVETPSEVHSKADSNTSFTVPGFNFFPVRLTVSQFVPGNYTSLVFTNFGCPELTVNNPASSSGVLLTPGAPALNGTITYLVNNGAGGFMPDLVADLKCNGGRVGLQMVGTPGNGGGNNGGGNNGVATPLGNFVYAAGTSEAGTLIAAGTFGRISIDSSCGFDIQSIQLFSGLGVSGTPEDNATAEQANHYTYLLNGGNGAFITGLTIQVLSTQAFGTQCSLTVTGTPGSVVPHNGGGNNGGGNDSFANVPLGAAFSNAALQAIFTVNRAIDHFTAFTSTPGCVITHGGVQPGQAVGTQQPTFPGGPYTVNGGNSSFVNNIVINTNLFNCEVTVTISNKAVAVAFDPPAVGGGGAQPAAAPQAPAKRVRAPHPTTIHPKDAPKTAGKHKK